MKPKPLSSSATRTLSIGASTTGVVLTSRQCQDVLAALRYERQRVEEALDFIAKQAKSFAGLPRGQEMDAFLAKHGYQKGEDAPTYSAEHRRKQTAAVVPKAKPRCHCGHLQQNHFNQHAGGGCKVANCGCPRFVCD